MFTCATCKNPIEDGDAMVTVADGFVFNGGEVDHQNTEYYHLEHVDIRPR